MKKLFLCLAAMAALVMSSCSNDLDVADPTTDAEAVKDVTVTLGITPDLKITGSTTDFSKVPSTRTAKLSTRAEGESDNFTPAFPDNYKAYFVCTEGKGKYVTGQVVDSVNVKSGSNTITLPALKYKVYVTNYNNGQNNVNNPWYQWGTAKDQLPQGTATLYLYGKNENVDLTGTTPTASVTLDNPYAAVCIRKNVFVTGAPTYYGNSATYSLVGNWYYLYIRGNKTNTNVPVNIAGYPNPAYTLNKDITAGQIYQYTFTGEVNGVSGDFTVTVNPFGATNEENVDPLK